MSIFKERIPVQDAGAPPKEGAARFAHILQTYPVRLVWLSILFTLSSLPILTIPASIAGLCHVTDEMDKGNGILSVTREFYRGFASSFMNRLVTYLGTVSIPCIVSMVALTVGLDSPYAAGAALAVWLVLRTVYDWFGVVVEEVELGYWASLKDAFILFFTQWKRTLLLALSLAAEAALVWFLYPYCILALVFFLFGTRQYLVSRVCCMTVRKKLGNTVEEEKEGSI